VSSSLSPFPDSKRLLDGLASALIEYGLTDGPVSVLKREANPYTSTFPGEIITLRFADGREVRVLGKYEGTVEEDADGHRRGLDYEIAVYAGVLRPIQLSTPRFYGGYRDPSSGQSWLFIEYVDQTWRVHKTPFPKETVPLAARWIGQFHACAERFVSHASPPFLVNYDREYYLRWPRRTFLVTRQVHDCWPWLANLCKRAEELLPLLCTGTETIIHGECFPKNILFRKGRICPVDWQSAARAAGEIDIAALLSGHWGEAFVEQCKQEYLRARWPAGPPHDFEFRMRLAQLYWPMRFLADMEPAVSEDDVGAWVEELRSPAEGLGLA
jgi:hypothetical protein